MLRTTFHGRRGASIENALLRVTVLEEGGHVAEVFHKGCGINPLWVPPWPSIEPGGYHDRTEYGDGVDAQLLSGIMGHNLCLDIFGGPSEEEFDAGIGVHGEAAVNPYEIGEEGEGLTMTAVLRRSSLRVERHITLEGDTVRIREAVENRLAIDRPIAWTQHVTLGPPFLTPGATEFRASATRSKVFESAFGKHDYLKPAAEFEWPHAPLAAGGAADLQVFNSAPASSGFTTHLMDQSRKRAWFTAFTPAARLLFGYVWNTADFPWMGIWEENRSRTHAPWNGRTIARGMEFGVSPMPESRRAMVERGRLFGVPAYRWLPALAKVEVEYAIVAREAGRIAELA